MPTVMRIGGLRVVVYPNDHRPPHVHVMGEGCEAVFLLGCPGGAVLVRENYGFPATRLADIQAALSAAQAALCRAWSEIHGHL